MRRSGAWVVLALLLGLPACSREEGRESPRARPNILFVFTDDHGAQTIGAYGSNRNRTPAMDRLASGGMRFANCFCTNSICAPSRATILTGKHTHLTGHTTNERIFDSRERTFPQLLQEAGYQTALIGKWHLWSEPKGFDHWDILINQGVYYNPPMIRNGRHVQHTGYTTDILTDLTLEWLEKHRDRSRPFLLLSHHKAPHRSWEPALRHLDLYRDVTLPEPPTLFEDWSNRSSAWSKAEMSIARHMGPGDLHLEIPDSLLTPEQRAVWDAAYGPENEAFRRAGLQGDALTRWKYQRFAKDYLRTVAAVDDGVGRILDYLDEKGLAADTIVIYASDQGWYLGEHGMFDKRWMYEESLRMPLLVRWPGVVPAGSVNEHLVQNLDLAQTLLDAAGVPAPPGVQGRSLLPLLRGETPPDWRRSVYYHFYEDEGAHRVPRHYGVRTGRHKLIHYYKLGQWELFDLQSDPLEQVSLYGRPGTEAITAELKAELARLRREYAVTEEADREVDTFQRIQQARFELVDALAPLPSRWGVEVESHGEERAGPCRRERLAYRIGGSPVTASLLLPVDGEGPVPGVVAAGLSDPEELCKRGYAVLAPDPPRTTRKPGQQVVELWFAADYLARRPEVHATRIGVIGEGEGGALATLLSSVDEELVATVSLGGAPHWALSSWGTFDDAVTGIYPRPFLAIGPAVLERARARYRDRDYTARLQQRTAGDGEARAAAFAWLDRWLKP